MAKYPADDEVADAKEAFQRCEEALSENYEQARDDLRFSRLGEQWPATIRRARELEGRPCLTINRMPAFIRQVVNDSRQNKPAITVHPVDSDADPETAEILDGLIRHIEQSSDAEVAYDTAIDFAASGGFGFFGINTRYATDDGFEQDIVIERKSNPLSIYGDPESTAADSSDWNVAFELETLSDAAFKKRFGKDTERVSFTSDSYSEKTKEEDRITIAAYWSREDSFRKIVALSPPGSDDPNNLSAASQLFDLNRLVIDLAVYEKNKDLFDALGMSVQGQPRSVPTHKVTQKILSGKEVLETIDWAGKYIPIVPVYGEEVTIEGIRHFRSLIRDAKDTQRMLNYWRTTTTELVALAPKTPFIGQKGSFETDAPKWATANTETHAYIEYDGNTPPQRQPFAGPPAGAIQEALTASDDMKAILGLYDASLGAKSNETSGRAILARQKEGDVSTFHIIDNLSRAIRHGGRIILDLIPTVYSTPRIVRILGADGVAKGVQIAPQGQQAPGPQQLAVSNQTAEDSPQDEAQEISRVFDLTLGKYDLTVTAGPSFTTRREEAANQMIQLIQAYPQIAPMIGDLLAKNLDWPGADEIADRLHKMLPAQLQGTDPQSQALQAQLQQLAQLLGQAKAKITDLETDKSNESRKVDVDAFNAETNRLKAIAGNAGTGFDPAQMAPVVLHSLIAIAQSPDILEAAGQGVPPDQLASILAQRMGQQQPMPPQTPAQPVT